MLIQATTPRPVFDSSRHPQYIHIHTLQKAGVSDGAVIFFATTDPEHAKRDSKELDPVHQHPIEGAEGFGLLGAEGFGLLEYIVPFWELFQLAKTKKPQLYDGRPVGEQGGVAVGNVGLARYCTNGFQITVRSAFRASTYEYEQHVIALNIVTAVTGGGVIRVADCAFDIANPTFDPYASSPHHPKNLELGQAFNRTHRLAQGPNGRAAELRAARIAEAEANLRKNQMLAGKSAPQLPSGTRGDDE